MTDIGRYKQIGRVFMKKHFSGQIDPGDGTEACLAMVSMPQMIFPKRQWLRWKIFSDPSESIDPHEYEQWVLSERIGNFTRTETDASFDDATDPLDMMEKYLPNDPDQSDSETVIAQDVGITGGEYQSLQGKNAEIMNRKYTAGLPNHAMLIGSKEIMFHAIGDTNKNPYMKVPMQVSVDEPTLIGIGFTRNQPYNAGTNEEDSITGDFNNYPSRSYDTIVAALPAPVGEHNYLHNYELPEATIEVGDSTESGADVFNWLSQGYTQGTYGDDVKPSIHYRIAWTLELGVYVPHTTSTLSAP